MSASWLVPRRVPMSEMGLALDDVSLLLDSASQPEPGRAMLEFLNRLVTVDYFSIVRFGATGPTMVEGLASAEETHNITRECFARYRACFLNADQVVHRGEQMRSAAEADSPVLALHMHRSALPDPAWREQIYVRERLASRLTLLYAVRPGSVYAVQLYRHERHGDFHPDEMKRLVAIAPLLRKAHRQALSSSPNLTASPIGGDRSHTPAIDERIARALARVERLAPMLSAREGQVCARIACGLSVDGIAADLRVAPSTVVTLRRRAYAKLGVNDRLALARLAG